MNFSDDLDDIDLSIEEHLCDDAVLSQCMNGGVAIPVRVMVNFPTELDRLQGMSFSRTRPVVSISHRAAPDLKEGDTLSFLRDEWWRIASAPTRSGDGRWWEAEIERYG